MQIGTWNKSNSWSRRAVRICDEVGGSRSDAPKVSLLRVANIRLNAGNGEIVAVGGSYVTLAAAKEGCAAVQRAAGGATVVEAGR